MCKRGDIINDPDYGIGTVVDMRHGYVFVVFPGGEMYAYILKSLRLVCKTGFSKETDERLGQMVIPDVAV